MKFYRLSDATFYDCINTIYYFIKHFLDKKKMSTFEEYGAFDYCSLWSGLSWSNVWVSCCSGFRLPLGLLLNISLQFCDYLYLTIMIRYRGPYAYRTNNSQQTNNIAGTSIQRRCNVTTLQRRCFDVVCLLGLFFWCWTRIKGEVVIK